MSRHTSVGLVVAVAVVWGAALAQQPDPGASDFDGDGIVGFEDFLTLAAGYGKAAGEPGFDSRLDLNADGLVDFTDFLRFARTYGQSVGDAAPDLLYVADLLAGRLVVVNTATNLTDLSRTVDLSQPRGLAFSPADDRVYVAGVDSFYALTGSSARLYQVPLLDPASAPDGVSEARGGFKVALAEDLGRAFVTEEFVGRVEVLNLQDGASLGQIPVGPEPVGIAMSPVESEALVAGKGRWLYRIDTQALALGDSIALGGWGNGRLAISSDGTRAYTARTLETGSPSVQIVEVDLTTGEVSRSHEVVVPGDWSAEVVDVALQADGARLLATVQRLVPAEVDGVASYAFHGSLVAVDLAGFTRSAEVRLGERVGTVGLSADGRTAYVGGIASITQDPAFKVFIVDVETMTSAGSLPGFDLPAAIATPPAKPSGLPPLPDLAVF